VIKTVVAELVDALDLGSSKVSCGGSSPPNRIIKKVMKKESLSIKDQLVSLPKNYLKFIDNTM
jgi:hypothetical protein